MFGDQRQRLLRGIPWKSVDDFAEELAAMFSDEQTMDVGPNGLTLDSSQNSPFNFPDWQPSDTIFTLGSGPGAYILKFGDITGGAIPSTGPPSSPTQTVPPEFVGLVPDDYVPRTPDGSGATTEGGNAFIGRVVSGSGSSYVVDLIGFGEVSVTQLQIASGETIPEGTAAVVIKVGRGAAAAYYMQVPVWLSRS